MFNYFECKLISRSVSPSFILRHILTAAHCICWYDDVVIKSFGSSNPKPTLRCLPNIEGKDNKGRKKIIYANQIQHKSTKSYNKIYYIVGVKKLPAFDAGAQPCLQYASTSAGTWSPAMKGIVISTQMHGNEINLNTGYDVGLVTIPSITTIKPISVPKRYH